MFNPSGLPELFISLDESLPELISLESDSFAAESQPELAGLFQQGSVDSENLTSATPGPTPLPVPNPSPTPSAVPGPSPTPSAVPGPVPTPITPTVDPGSDLITALDLGVLSSSLSIQEFVGDTDPFDFYAFTLNQQSNLNLSLSGLNANADVWVTDGTMDDLGVLNGVDISMNPYTEEEWISASSLAAGTYYVLVMDGPDGLNGPSTNYNLTLSTGGTVDPGDYFNTALDLGVLNSSLSVQQAVDGSDPLDFYAFTLNQPGNFSLSLNGLSANADVALYDSARNSLGASFNLSTAEDSLSGSLAAGTYYVSVVNENSFLGPTATNYNLDLSIF